MLIVKIMGPENAPDSDTRKTHDLYAGVKSARFVRTEDGPGVAILFAGEAEEEIFPVTGNVYVMNEAGKTIDSFGVSPIPSAEEHQALIDALPGTSATRTRPIDWMVNRFLAWRLPASFHPDGGITFANTGHEAHWPSGTNLFDYEQAKAMITHLLGED